MSQRFFDINPRLQAISDRAEAKAKDAFVAIDATTEYNQQKVLSAYIRHQVSETHFIPTTGYGYGDRGRDALDEILADIMGAEDALIRHSIVSGTHAIAIALFAILRPGDTLLAATGAPYDTLEKVIGHTEPSAGSLAEYGVKYSQVELTAEQLPDLNAIQEALRADSTVKMVHIQRSRGYNTRPSLTIEWIERIVKAVRAIRKDVIIFVDNCYGEFVEMKEPNEVGADLIAGSLIKNPGGGIAENGGYLCGTKECIEQCSYRMTTPGLGREVGASLGHNRALYMGLFQAPHVVGEALKTAVYAAALFSELGYAVSPTVDEHRADIIQTIMLENSENLVAFCQGMQKGAPVDAYVVPEPWDMPGYTSQVIMAAGAFTMGASIELSADAPLREPFAAYMQGGLNYHSGKIGVLLAAQSMLDKGYLSI